MSNPTSILPYPYVLITDSGPKSGIVPINGSYNVGLVISVYDTSDRVLVGQYVVYDPKKVINKFIFGSTIYLMISDEFISGQDIPLV